MVQSRQKSVSLSGHITDRLCGVGKSRATPLRECGAQRQIAKAWLQGHGKSGHLSDWLRQKRPPGGTLPLLLAVHIILYLYRLAFLLCTLSNLPFGRPGFFWN